MLGIRCSGDAADSYVLLLLLLASLEQTSEAQCLWMVCEQTQGAVTHINHNSRLHFWEGSG